MLRIIKGPYLQWPTRNSITIMWETSCAARSRVTYYQTEKVHSGLNGKLRSIETSGLSKTKTLALYMLSH